VYGSETTIHDLQRVFIFAFNGENRFPGYVNPVPNIIMEPFKLGETLLTPLPVPHGRTTVFGYLFARRGKKLAAYLSDCKSVPDPVIEQIRGVPHLILDALRHKPHPTHMNIEEALVVSSQVNPGRAWFTHLSHEVMHSELESKLPENVRIAFDGLKLAV
jgi:phosphoribosyl 1,2-cyclic phosphate phosphodiesterase